MAHAKLLQAKHWIGSKIKKIDHRMTMEGILSQARQSFEYFLSGGGLLNFEKKMSRKLMRDAKGVVFLTEANVGAGLGGAMVGTGIIIVRSDTDPSRWSPPIAVGTGGFSFGPQFGLSKIDHVIILPKAEHVKAFLGKGQLSMKGSVEAVIANIGRDANVGVGVSDRGDTAPIMSYSFGVKGLYGGVTVGGSVLVPRNDCNAAFYGHSVNLHQIANGQVEAPLLNDDYKKIIKLLGVHQAMMTSAEHSAQWSDEGNQGIYKEYLPMGDGTEDQFQYRAFDSTQ